MGRSYETGAALFNLTKIQLNRRSPAENLYSNLQLALLVVDRFDDSGEIVERAIDDADDLARLEQHLRPRLVHALADPLQNLVCLLGRSDDPPMKPSTFGTSFTRCQVSSSISICTST